MVASSIGFLGIGGGSALPSHASSGVGPAASAAVAPLPPASPGSTASGCSSVPDAASVPSSSESPAVARALASGINPEYLYIPGPAASACQEAAAEAVGHITPEYAWPDYPLAGSVVGGSIQAGNFWWDYGMAHSEWSHANPYLTLPYTEAGAITHGGDDAPLLYTPLYQIELVPTGLPSTVSWGYSVVEASNVDNSFGYADESVRADAEINLTGAPISTYIVDAHTSSTNYGGTQAQFTVTGNASVDLAFAAVYNVTFTESGLPANSVWSVSINGTSHLSETGSKVEAELENGTFLYLIRGYPGYSQSTLPYSGTIHIAGAPVDEPTLAFAPRTFSITFAETGLPSGTWSVAVNGTTYSGTVGLTITAALPNGTYPYLISDSPGYHQSTLPYSGSVTVHGAAVLEPTLVFESVVYLTTFSQTGLPSGANWSVTFGTATVYSTTAALFIEAPNETYDYAVNPVGPYYAQSGGNGTVVVAGSPVSVEPTVYAYTVVLSFSETGLPIGSTWSINVSNPDAHWQNASASGTITFRLLSNTTYSYLITAPAGYSISAPSGSVPLGASGHTVPPVTIAPTSGASSTPWYDLLWIWVALGVLIVVGAVGVAALRMRHRGPGT